jgi:hypothetical protein
MKLQHSTNLLSLASEPLQEAVLQIVKPLQVWLGKFQMRLPGGTKSSFCQLFEPSSTANGDQFLVDGKHELYLIRDGFKWPARLYAMASSSHSLMALDVARRAAVSRIKPVQACITNGDLRFCGSTAVPLTTVVPPTLLSDAEAAYWIGQCDLLQSCEYNSEWRFLTPVAALRQKVDPRAKDLLASR